MIYLIIVFLSAVILIRDKENKIIFEILAIIKETFKYICELLKQKKLEVTVKESHLKLY